MRVERISTTVMPRLQATHLITLDDGTRSATIRAAG